MSKSRIKAPVIVITREEMLEAMATLRQVKIDEQDANSRLTAAVDKARLSFDEELAALKVKEDAAFARVKTWATANPKEFVEPKSITTPFGTLGFRLGKYGVRSLKSSTLEDTLAFLMERRWLKKRYVRVINELNKEALIADRAKLTRKPKLLEKMGIRFGQPESFFADTEVKTTDAILKEAA